MSQYRKKAEYSNSSDANKIPFKCKSFVFASAEGNKSEHLCLKYINLRFMIKLCHYRNTENVR